MRIYVVRVRLTLGLRSFLQSVSRLLKLATKPGRSELWQSIKICLLGITAIGLIGFVIKLISFVLAGL
ncbi:protein translocase SEC61 complex subunit gamma [Candidatus Bathyarchaeota archaeon]|nr:protein translocase SEC61 complex subunit gamma [Candidatus Bathyarchaeota archaeon]